MKKTLITLSALILAAMPALAEFNNKIHVYKPETLDGDTIGITLNEGFSKVRLTGIDCFESTMNDRVYYQMRKTVYSKQEILQKGVKAKAILEGIITKNSNEIWLNLTGVDKKYGRLVGVIYYKDKNGNFVNINEIMKKSGYCPAYVFNKKY